MKGLAFFDTNVLIYADDVSAKGKRERAISLIVEHRRNKSLVTSLRVLREYYAAATRKRASQRKLRKVKILAHGKLVRFTEHDVIASIELHRLSRVSFWDAMIIHAARSAGAVVFIAKIWDMAR